MLHIDMNMVILNYRFVHPKVEALMLERVKAGEEGDNRGQDGWMAPQTQWT